MKLLRRAMLPLMALVFAAPAFAQGPDWLARCNRELGGDNAPETATYVYETRGKVSKPARATADYTATASSSAAVYLTDAKDLLNPYVGPSISVGYFLTGESKTPPSVGQFSVRAMAKGFKPIPGAPVTMKVVIDGKTFGPYQPQDASSGSYAIWFDTADTDGDSKPPVLKPDDFAKLATALDAMQAVELVLVQNGVDIVRTNIPVPQRTLVRDNLAGWAFDTSKLVGANSCIYPDTVVN